MVVVEVFVASGLYVGSRDVPQMLLIMEDLPDYNSAELASAWAAVYKRYRAHTFGMPTTATVMAEDETSYDSKYFTMAWEPIASTSLNFDLPLASSSRGGSCAEATRNGNVGVSRLR